MKYLHKILGIFCFFVILPGNNGEFPAGCPIEGCEPCKAEYLNDQIRQKLMKYPEVYFPKLGLEETFNELRGDLRNAMIRKPKPDKACAKAGQALVNFQQFLLQYEDIKGMLVTLRKKLIKIEELSYLSEEEKFEAFRLSLILEDSKDIESAKENIRNIKMFLRQLSPPTTPLPPPKTDNNVVIRDGDKASLMELIKRVTEALDSMHNQTGLATNDPTKAIEAPEKSVQNLVITLAENLTCFLNKPLPNKDTPFNDLLNIIAENLNNMLTNPSLYQNDKVFEQSVNTLAESIAKIINKETGNNQTNFIEPVNDRIIRLLRSYPEKEDTRIRLNQIFNQKRQRLIEVGSGAIDLAEKAIKDFTVFVEKYKTISHRLESVVQKLAMSEANPNNTIETKYQALKCRTRLEKSETIDEARNALINCATYSEATNEINEY